MVKCEPHLIELAEYIPLLESEAVSLVAVCLFFPFCPICGALSINYDEKQIY